MKKIAVALTIAAAIAAAPALAGDRKDCPGSVAQDGVEPVAAFVARILSRFGSGRIFGDYCRPN
jgi:hypothetical protein